MLKLKITILNFLTFIFKFVIIKYRGDKDKPDIEVSKMYINKDGIDLIKKFEGLRLKAYKCPAGVWTIGYGHTEGVNPDDEITADEAHEFLVKDIAIFDKAVDKYVTIACNMNIFSALVSFCYNVGVNNFKKSTLLKHVNAFDFKEASEEFIKWDKVRNPKTGKLESSSGLRRRRRAERALFLKPRSSGDN